MIAQATLAHMCEVTILLCAPGWLVVSEAKQLSILSAMVFADKLFYIQSFLFAFTFAFDTALAPRQFISDRAWCDTAT